MGMIFNHGALGLVNGDIDWAADTIRARLSRTSENAVDKDATAMTGLGLSATDVTLGSKTGPSKDNAVDRIEYACGSIAFTAVGAGAEVDKIIVFKFNTNDASSTPIAVVDLNPARTPNGGDINLTIHADGLFYLQQ